ncbi:MAG: CoA transferase [Calditrichaeota bacterium]|nr:CoA transferase [Calditrichota bacterium]
MKKNSITAADILNTLPHRMRPEQARDWRAVFHFDIRGKQGGRFTVAIDGGRCEVKEGLVGEPDCVVQAKDRVFIGIELGEINPQVAFLTRRVKVSNVPAMLQFGKLFYSYWQWQKMRSGSDVSTEASSGVARERKGPLSGVRILDFTRLYPGPLATMMMGELGAEIIKIEDPTSPDPMRFYPPHLEDQSAGFLAVNRFKYSLALNYRHPEGQRVFLELVARSDAVIESFRPGIMDEMGIGYRNAREVNPGIIYISVTGYGQNGPLANQASHDLNYLALSGILSMTGTPERPVIPGIQLADIAGGAYMAFIATLIALWQRERTGQGQHLDVSMLDGTFPLMTLQWAHFHAMGQTPPRGEGILSGGMAAYNVYRCADGKFVALAAIEPKFWETFCEQVGHPEWKDSYFTIGEAQHELIQQVADVFARHSSDYWLKLAETHDICLTPVLDMEEVPVHLHIRQRRIFHPGDALPHIRVPLNVSEANDPGDWPAPRLGQHSIQVLKNAGFSQEAIERLVQNQIILQE